MTKLTEWLSVFIPLFSIWYLLVTKKLASDFAKENETIILYCPIVAVLLFGLYAATVVLYRVFTFNNCEEASIELHKEIQTAREDLKSLGFVFKTADG